MGRIFGLKTGLINVIADKVEGKYLVQEGNLRVLTLVSILPTKLPNVKEFVEMYSKALKDIEVVITDNPPGMDEITALETEGYHLATGDSSCNAIFVTTPGLALDITLSRLSDTCESLLNSVGAKIPFGKSYIEAVPAHFLHSPGNFHFYDPISKVYFSGDMGAAIFPKDKWYLIVENFEEHVKLMEGFHRRYIPSKAAIEKWLNRIQGMDIRIIAPQHGSIFMEKDVKNFLDWLRSLDKVGLDLL
ncbi:hypothetical protein MsedC_0528 [Metallosphaera sedula]|uniref:ODP domain-containing protein n=1 Tax=Metallosphaera sedula TaxID=43687 RepID=A0A0K1T5A1_9CREN|nr:hypothetical protein MsedA_0529 [Metallosphaera sedula]AKV77496.1 hypothetical protein MsedB_0529 [Metallosphaera sedula]AKV79743.1 hypothetical protein MsedC_0528 [Metallosphaera sedula]AKV81988.1 hypothetical protein MsedD_0529 [Metallosphaera sedula]AKV84221.1 hypothetical protein MsedE_0529 [Metallosphaera sedula]